MPHPVQQSKFIKLSKMALLSVGVLIAFLLLQLIFLLIVKYVFGFLDGLPFFSVAYSFALHMLPASGYIVADYLMIGQIKKTSRKAWLTKLLITLTIGVIIINLFAQVTDALTFIKKPTFDINGFIQFSIGYLVSNFAFLVFLSLVLALQTPKEPFWLHNYGEDNDADNNLSIEN